MRLHGEMKLVKRKLVNRCFTQSHIRFAVPPMLTLIPAAQDALLGSSHGVMMQWGPRPPSAQPVQTDPDRGVANEKARYRNFQRDHHPILFFPSRQRPHLAAAAAHMLIAQVDRNYCQ
jgi:hypothetical protein